MSSPTSNKTPYEALVARIADQFVPGDMLWPADLQTLSDAELAVVIEHQDQVAIDAFRPIDYAEVLNSAVYLTEQSKAMAFWTHLRSSAQAVARHLLASDVNTVLHSRSEPVGDWRAAAADGSAVSGRNFA